MARVKVLLLSVVSRLFEYEKEQLRLKVKPVVDYKMMI